MGLGKTASALTALTDEHLPALVTAPKRVAELVWEDERDKWRPDLSIGVAIGPPAKRAGVLAAHQDVTVISRDNLADALRHRAHYRTVILDELSGFKARSSVRWKIARQLTKSTPHIWGLTGTPSPNTLLDLWAQMYLLDNGVRLGRTLTEYREKYFTVGWRLPNNGVVVRWDLRDGAEAKIHRLLEDICLSMDTEGRIDLPPVTVNKVEVPLTPKVRDIYRKMKKDLLVDLKEFGILDGQVHTADNAAVLGGRLSQICAGFLFVDKADLHNRDYQVLHWDRVRALKEVVEGTGSPVLAFYQFLPERDMIRKSMPELVHTVEEKDVFRRWNRGEIPVLLAHPSSIGHGLNLQAGGHTVVWASLPFSLEQYSQSIKRLIRQGQQHPVVIHILNSPNTMDGVKWDVLMEKKTVQQALLDHLESPI